MSKIKTQTEISAKVSGDITKKEKWNLEIFLQNKGLSRNKITSS